MLSKQSLELLNMKKPDGTTMSAAEKIASLPPDVIMRMLDTHARLAAEGAQKKALDDAMCRLLASGYARRRNHDNTLHKSRCCSR